MKKILVTGSNGFIGQEILYQALSNSDVILLALSKGQNRFSAQQGYTYISADVTDQAEMENVMKEHRPDCVIHTVAMANVDACEQDAELCDQVNVQVVEELVLLAEVYHFHLIYLSTDFIFDGANGPYKEEDLPNPLNVYGASKLKAEQIIRSSTCKWSIVRTILVYGAPHESSRSNFVLWVKSALEAKESIKVVTDHIRMPTLVDDVANACLRIADQEALGIYHISSEEVFSVFELAIEVAKFWNLDSTLIQPVLSTTFSQSVARPNYTGFIIEKAKLELGFQPRSLQEGLEQINRRLFS